MGNMLNKLPRAPAAVTRRVVLSGVLQVTAGCLSGAIPAAVIRHQRSIGGAHMLLVQNCMLQTVVGLAVPLMDLPPRALLAFEALLAAGTWSNGLAMLAGGLTGRISPLIANASVMQPYPAPPVVSEWCANHVLTMLCVPTVLGALALAAVGLARGMRAPVAKRE